MDPFSAQINDLLVSTYRSIVKVEEAMLKNLSGDQLSISEMHMLESVARGRDEGRTITELAQESGITPPSVTMAIKRLEHKGYVSKARGARDGRVVMVRLTESGRRAEVAHRYFHRKMVKSIIGSVPQADRALLLGALTNLHAFLKDQAEALVRHP